MKLQKAWYTIGQVADKWGCTEDDVLHQINIYNLNPSFFFESVKCAVNKSRVKIGENGRSRCWLQKSEKLPCWLDKDGKSACDKDSLCVFDEDGNRCGVFDEDTPVITHSGLVSLLLPSGEFIHKFLSVTREWTCDLTECFFVPGPFRHPDNGFEILSPLESKPLPVIISAVELQRFESIHSAPATPEAGNVCSSPTETDMQLCDRLKANGLDLKDIAKELKRLFPGILPSKIGRLLPARPGTNIGNDAHRKQGERLLK